MTAIVLTRRSDDWHAAIKGEPGRWGCGKSPAEALGTLVLARPEAFGVEVEWTTAVPLGPGNTVVTSSGKGGAA